MARSVTASHEIAIRRKQREADEAAARAAAEVAFRAADAAARRQYPVDRAEDAGRRTAELRHRVELLSTLLARGLRRPAGVDLAGLRRRVNPPPLDLSGLGWPGTPPDPTRYEPARPSPLGGEARYRRELAEARAELERARAAYELAEGQRRERLADARRRHAAQLAAERRSVEEHNRAVDEFLTALGRRDPVAVAHHLELALERTALPAGFPRAVEVAAAGERAAVRVALPPRDVLPAAAAIEYDEAEDELHEVPRPAAELDALHDLVLDQVALLVLRDVFGTDPGLHRVALHGELGGREVLRLEVDRETFEQLELGDPEECMAELTARIAS